MKNFISIISFVLLLISNVCPELCAQTKHRVDKSTDFLSVVPATTGIVIAFCKKDYTGLKQLALSGASSIAANYLLELSIKKDRPDGSGHHAFPSTHTAVSFSGAAYLQRRYGWKWGGPAFAISVYVGWGRIFAKKHDIWDVLAGAAIGAGTGYIYTRPFASKANLSIAPTVVNNNPGIYLSACF